MVLWAYPSTTLQVGIAMTSLADAIRAIRDLLVIIGGLGVAVAIRLGGNPRNWVIGALIIMAAVGVISYFASLTAFPRHPYMGLHFLEGEMLALIALTISMYATAFVGLGALATHFSQKDTEKYWFGAASGIVLGALAAGFMRPGADKWWLQVHVKNRLKRIYANASESWGLNAPQVLVLELESPPDDKVGQQIRGWGIGARRKRAKVLVPGYSVQPTVGE
jgi:hypothetical protein